MGVTAEVHLESALASFRRESTLVSDKETLHLRVGSLSTANEGDNSWSKTNKCSVPKILTSYKATDILSEIGGS